MAKKIKLLKPQIPPLSYTHSRVVGYTKRETGRSCWQNCIFWNIHMPIIHILTCHPIHVFCLQAFIYKHICPSLFIYVNIHVFIYKCIYCMHVCLCLCMHLYLTKVCAYSCMCIYMDTYKHRCECVYLHVYLPHVLYITICENSYMCVLMHLYITLYVWIFFHC